MGRTSLPDSHIPGKLGGRSLIGTPDAVLTTDRTLRGQSMRLSTFPDCRLARRQVAEFSSGLDRVLKVLPGRRCRPAIRTEVCLRALLMTWHLKSDRERAAAPIQVSPFAFSKAVA